VAATLLADPELAKLPVEVLAERGVVKIFGIGPPAIDHAVELARAVQGVRSVVVGS
jgi:osmotically-inducible protein OsmY